MSEEPEGARPPVPERFGLHAPQMVPVWIPRDRGGWILVASAWLAEFRALNPDLPDDCFPDPVPEAEAP